MVATADQKNDGHEHAKMAVDVMKHLTTLATGGILFIVAVYDKGNISGRGVMISTVGMVLSLMSSLSYLFFVGIEGRESRQRFLMLLAMVSLFFFAFGAGALAGATSIRPLPK